MWSPVWPLFWPPAGQETQFFLRAALFGLAQLGTRYGFLSLPPDRVLLTRVGVLVDLDTEDKGLVGVLRVEQGEDHL